MLSWLKSLFSRGRGRECTYRVYDPGEMLIYSYFNGTSFVRADPVRLYKAIMAVGPEMAIDIKVSNSPSKDAGQAHNELLSKIRTIFNVKPVEEGGLTESATVDLFDHFMEFCEQQKKNSSQLSTLSTSEDSPPISEGVQATQSSSVSGSTDGESSTAEPAPSLTAPA